MWTSAAPSPEGVRSRGQRGSTSWGRCEGGGGEGAGAGILWHLSIVDGERWQRDAEPDDLVDCLLAAEEERERVVGMVS